MADLLEFTRKLKKIGTKAIDETLLEQIKLRMNSFESEHDDAIREQDHLIENIEKKKYLKIY